MEPIPSMHWVMGSQDPGQVSSLTHTLSRVWMKVWANDLNEETHVRRGKRAWSMMNRPFFFTEDILTQ